MKFTGLAASFALAGAVSAAALPAIPGVGGALAGVESAAAGTLAGLTHHKRQLGLGGTVSPITDSVGSSLNGATAIVGNVAGSGDGTVGGLAGTAEHTVSGLGTGKTIHSRFAKSPANLFKLPSVSWVPLPL